MRKRVTAYRTEGTHEKAMAWIKNAQIATSFLNGKIAIPENDDALIQPLPPDKKYWTLANDQSHEKSEIATLVQRGFIYPEQFYGVDLNEAWYENNCAAHPQAHFFTDDWLHAIRTPDFNPGVVYLDTTEGLTKRNLRLLVGTMECCPADTVLFFNFSENNPYDVTHRRAKKKDVADLINELMETCVFEFSKWHKEIPSYRYNQTGFTNMVTLAFFKRRIG